MLTSLLVLLALFILITGLMIITARRRLPAVNWLIFLLTIFSALVSLFMISSLMSLIASLSIVWAVINNSRLLTGRRSYQLTHKVVVEGWVGFLALFAILMLLDYILVDSLVVAIFSFISLFAAIITLSVTIYHSITYRMNDVEILPEKQLPTVSLAIPARNETHAIEATLKRAVHSNYPKLEILVLDDCSQDRTPQLIREFAHGGIRFIEGVPVGENWLGKNAAYKALTEDSSGEYILFAGVDVSLGPDSIDQLVAYALENDLEMLSVMPQRTSFDWLANFLQTTRYFFQYMLPWELLPINPVLSSLWLIKRSTLLEMGNFDNVSHLVVPERYFANQLAKSHKYRFVVSDTHLSITSRKKISSQLETATRTLYPLFRSKPILSFLASAGLLLILVAPFVVVAYHLFGYATSNYYYALLTTILLVASNLIIYTRFNASTWFIGLFNFPIIVTMEALLIQWSMIKYEYSTVVWKDRNICIPVLNPPLKRQREKHTTN